jgi:metal-dependent HD superfamily phosphatase/phosphodiesterase
MVGNGVWLHNIGRVVKQKLHNNLTPSKNKKIVDKTQNEWYISSNIKKAMTGKK